MKKTLEIYFAGLSKEAQQKVIDFYELNLFSSSKMLMAVERRHPQDGHGMSDLRQDHVECVSVGDLSSLPNLSASFRSFHALANCRASLRSTIWLAKSRALSLERWRFSLRSSLASGATLGNLIEKLLCLAGLKWWRARMKAPATQYCPVR